MNRNRVGTRTLRHVLLIATLVFAPAAASYANPLNVPLDQFPVILAGFTSVSYNAGTGAFTASGATKTLDKGTGPTAYAKQFTLTATINSVTGVASTARLTVGPNIGTKYLSAVTLLQFGYDPVSGGALEFLFAPPTGALVTDGTYSGTKPIDVIFRGLTFPGTWASSWTNGNTAAYAEIRSDGPPPPEDSTAVPEPSTLLLLLTAVAATVGRGHRRRPGAK